MEKTFDFNILLVDDDADQLKLVSFLLQNQKYCVKTASNGQECIDAIKQHPPHLLLLDVILPDTNGVELCKRIKSDENLSSIHIILLSALKTESDFVSDGLESGADGYLFKPVKNRELLARVEAAHRIIKAENDLQNANERLLLSQQAAQSGIWDWDIDTDTLYWSNELYKIFGIDPEKENASIALWKNILHKGDSQMVTQLLEKASLEHMAVNFEFRITTFPDSVRWIHFLGETIISKQNNQTRMLGICLDVTDRKHMEMELKTQSEELKRFNSFFVNRELRMIELKTEINQLLERLGDPPKYDVVA